MQFKIEEWTKLSSLIDEQIAKLKKIGTNETGYTISADRLKRLKKRLQNASEGATVSFTEQDKVDLCWHIDELDNLSDFFLEHYLTDWSDRFGTPLNNAIAKNWDKNDFCTTICSILNEHNALHTFFHSEGHTKLAEHLITQEETALQAVSYTPCSTFTYPFYGAVIREFYQQKNCDWYSLDDLEKTLSEHNNQYITKTVLPQFIIRINAEYRRGNIIPDNKKTRITQNNKKTRITQIAIKQIGSLDDEQKWLTPTLTEDGQRNIIEARRILKCWQAQCAATAVWETIHAQDEKRSAYWAKQAKEIHHSDINQPLFRIICSDKCYRNIFNSADEQGIWKKYHTCGHLENDNAAIMMRFNHYTVVEFLNIGGGCAYFLKANHRWTSDGNHYTTEKLWKTVDHIDQIVRDSKLSILTTECNNKNAIEISPDSMKIEHRADWDDRIDNFFRYKVDTINQ
jgi:hypothetical protein